MKCFIYCTKGTSYLYRNGNKFYCNQIGKQNPKDILLNGKVVASFDLDDVERFTANNVSEEILKKSCLANEEISNYLKEKNGYGWNIKNLEIFDKPMNLFDFETQGICNMYSEIKKTIMGDYITKCYFKLCKYNYEGETCDNYPRQITKAPQSWQYAYDKNFEKTVLISIKPEWTCKILNGEKTIEVRKSYPKEVSLNE